MKIEMLSTGDEVLQGDIADTNAAWCGQELNELGLSFSRRQTVADNMDDIVPVVVWNIAEKDWSMLDMYEGYPSYYIKETVNVILDNGTEERTPSPARQFPDSRKNTLCLI